MNISKKELLKIKKNIIGKTVAIIGDMMIDSYYWGKVRRISPEAPVPVVEIEKEFDRFGGAANVALNIIKLGGTPLPMGVIGSDIDGNKFRSLLSEEEISSENIVKSSLRPTTSKTRVIGENQQIVRVDRETKENIDKKIEDKIIKALKNNIQKIDAIILEDYNKGVITERIINEVISLAKENNKIVTVDPKFNNFMNYKDVTVFKPNRKEAEDVLGISIKGKKNIDKVGKALLKELNAKYILLTLGKEGVALFEKGKEPKTFPTKARNVADVSGAGDTVIATITMLLAAGADISTSVYLANYAGGLVCETAGIIPIERELLFDTVIGEIE